MQSFRVSLGSGFGTSNYRQININDATVTFFQEFLNEPRGIDYFPARPTVPGAPTIAPPDQFSGGEFPTGLNGDVRNGFDQTEITPGSILNKDLLDITGLNADDIVFNAVKTDFSQDNVTNLRLIDVAEVLADDSLVPYDGATKDVDLGLQGITTEWVKLNTTPVIPTDQGSLYWDEDDDVLAVVLNGAIQKVGEVTFYNVKNQTGSTIPKGTGVGFAGVVGASARIKVAPYLADGSQPSIYYVGITAEAILDGEDGKVFNFGPIRGLNTSAFSEGDVLYASSTVAGGFTTTPPTTPNNVIVVAAVLTDSATVGALLVRITPADLGHLAVTIGSPANGLSINASTQVLNIGLASASANGALSSTDWSTFNGKEPAITLGTTAQYFRGDKTFQDFATAVRASVLTGYTVGANTALADTDSVLGAFGKVQGQLNAKEAAFTKNTAFNKNFGTAAGTVAEGNDSRFHNPVTLGTPNGLSLSDQALSLGLASTSTNGALSSTDWNTFNNKQNALTNPVTGTGVSGQVSFWNGTSSQTGENALFWDNTNKRLGIGFSIPTTKVEINNTAIGLPATSGTTQTTGALRLEAISFTGQVIDFGIGGSGGWIQSTRFDDLSSTGPIFLNPNGGNVLINTTTDAGFRLDVNGTARIQGNLNVSTGGITLTGAQTIQTSTGNLTLATAAGDGNIILSPHGTGNVGIGTTAPLFKLSVRQPTLGAIAEFRTIDGNNPGLDIKTSAAGTTLAQVYSTGASANLMFETNATERMRIDSEGNVGIGTSAPDANLTVNGAASFAAGTAAAPSIARAGDLNTGIFFPAADTIAASTVGSERMRITSAGRLLLGTQTESTFLLDVNGTARFTNGVRTGIPFGVNAAGTFLLGRFTDDIVTPNGSIRVQIGNNYYDIPAIDNGEVPV
jgi:hypothetical protein